MLVLPILSNLRKGQVELKVGQGKQKTHLPTGQVHLNYFFFPCLSTNTLIQVTLVLIVMKYLSGDYNFLQEFWSFCKYSQSTQKPDKQ